MWRVALFLDRQREAVSEQIVAGTSGERAERIVGIGDGAIAVAAHDDVALRFEEVLGALLRFLISQLRSSASSSRASSRRSSPFIWRMREIRRPMPPHAAPNRAATPIAKEYGS